MKINIDIYKAIKYSFDSLYKKEIINSNTIIVIPLLRYLIPDILKIRDRYNNKLVLVLYQSEIDKIPNDNNIEVITIPDMMHENEIFLMANDIKEEYDNSYLFNLEDNKEYENYYSKILAKELNIDDNDIYIPYIYGGLFKGLSKYIKLLFDNKIIAINYRNKELNNDLDYDLVIRPNDKIDELKNIFISCNL